jgi:hypothetical protein
MEQPRFGALAPEMKRRLARWQEEHAGEPLGDIATRLLFEDPKVKIWEMRLEPGEASALHRHDHDYYLVMLSGDRIAGVPPRESGAEPYVADLPPGGSAVFVKGGDTEWALNVGEQTFYEIVVELKDPPR